MKTLISHGTNALKLRNYQQEAISAVQSYGKNRPILVAATGAGKTVIGSKIMLDRLDKGPILFLAHRDELLDQTLEKFETVFDSAGKSGQRIRVGRIQAEQNDVDADVVVASVQTLANEKRLAAWIDAHGETPTIITDECHHARANSYLRIYEALGYLDAVKDTGGEEVERLHLGLTATPYRTDQKALNGVFDGVAYAIGLWELIEQGYLVPPKNIKLPLLEELRDVRGGDWSDNELNEQINNSPVNKEIVHAWEANAKERLTIAFCTSVGHAQALAETFCALGTPAAMVHGAMPKEERHKELDAFTKGEIRVLCNYGVLVEGFDRPEVSCLIMARPTTSHSLYVQAVGRGLRIAPHVGKQDCLVLDVVGVTAAHRLVTIDKLVQEREEAKEAEANKKPKSLGGGSSNRLHGVRPERFNWMQLANDVWMLRDFDGGLVRVVKENERWYVIVGQYASAYQNQKRVAEYRNPIEPFAEIVYQGADAEFAWGYAATYAHLNLKKSAIGSSESWMVDSPSDKQIEGLQKRGASVPETKFEAMVKLSKPTKKQEETLRNFLKRHHLPETLLPVLGDEASDMMNVCSTRGWLDVQGIVRDWKKVVPQLFLLQAAEAQRNAVAADAS